MPNMLASTSKFVTNSPKSAQAVVATMAEADEMFQKQPEKVKEVLSKVYTEAGYQIDLKRWQADRADGRESEIYS